MIATSFTLKSICTVVTMAVGMLSFSSWAALEASLMEGLKARSIGPATISERIAAIDAVASDPNHIVVGAATGGLWISDNGGLTWEPVFDDQPVASIGAERPSHTSEPYIEIAKTSLAEATAEINEFMEGELAELRAHVKAAGIGLLLPGNPIEL